MNYIEYKFSISPADEWREIVLAMVSDCGFDSFVDTDEGLNAYVQAELDKEDCVKSQLDSIVGDVNISYIKTEIEQKNWNAEWESNFNPINVNNRCYIRAEFHEPQPGFEHEVIIQPKMAFGTGHHETTHLMVEYILDTDFAGKDVLDMGCGTAILGILAAKKGAAYVEAIDIDDWATDNAIENAERNEVEINVRLGDAGLLKDRKFDIILANINRNVLLKDIPAYADVLRDSNSQLILSGLMKEDYEIIKAKAEECGLVFAERKQRNEWISLKFNNS